MLLAPSLLGHPFLCAETDGRHGAQGVVYTCPEWSQFRHRMGAYCVLPEAVHPRNLYLVVC